jgi:hypothetical protein
MTRHRDTVEFAIPPDQPQFDQTLTVVEAAASNRQIAKAMKVLMPPPDRRKQCREDVEGMVHFMLSMGRAAKRGRPTRKQTAAYSASLRKMQRATQNYVAAGGVPRLSPDDIDRAVRLERFDANQRSPGSRQQIAVALAHDLLSRWGGKIMVSRGGDWYRLAAALHGEGCPDLYQQLRKMRSEIRSRQK